LTRRQNIGLLDKHGQTGRCFVVGLEVEDANSSVSVCRDTDFHIFADFKNGSLEGRLKS